LVQEWTKLVREVWNYASIRLLPTYNTKWVEILAR